MGTMNRAISCRGIPAPNPNYARKEGVETISGQMTLAFGAFRVPMGRERRDAIHFLELLLAGGIAGTLGVLMALVWTAGFVPTFLEPNSASVLLAKPAARWQLLLGKYFGVLDFRRLPGCPFRRLNVVGLGAAYKRLGCGLPLVYSAAVASVRRLLQLLCASRRAHPQHGDMRHSAPYSSGF